MRVLVTNDDGIDSEGIQVLARALAAAGHDVLLVAPDTDQSGMGAALGNLQPDTALPVREVEVDGLAPGTAFALAGTPALTVVAAMLGGFGPPPELVVSGPNAGLNTGRSVLHSGTVGACLTGQNFGISGLAVSLEAADRWHWDTAAALAVETVPLVAAAPPRSVVNLNVPARERADVLGVRWARLAPFGAVRAAVSSRDGDRLQVELTATGYVPEPDTDQGTVEAGWASLTTLIGIAEAWPDAVPPDGPDGPIEPSLVAGAELHVAHRVPDATERRTLHRPRFA
ncbi:5'/3'-nucleotidase SurE [Aquihabitans sp. G128]|uniref:5'/3'-nucleotidase SurE n=1 Tax=Aquihabitans sp. G128 TaxID=2849779 RepID=UPI001C2383D3|nr:5'/3'-nucleotidase SurE [Aquihabitans sp. G128]QXC60743.1 5'/3'-nucleotidase SurE [Aquihabitans sp. G128]